MKRKHNLAMAIILALAVFTAYEFYISYRVLDISRYEIRDERIETSFRVVQLTDQHGSVFGDNNQELVERVSQEKPDIILITGDFIDYKAGDVTAEMTQIVNLISQLKTVAPVYISYGNHEAAYDSSNSHGSAESIYESAGATVLEWEYEDIDINGQAIRLGGIFGYCQPERLAMGTDREPENTFMLEFTDTDRYSILMCHMPYSWLVADSLYDWSVGCVYAGHTHGGQVQIPFVGGLWAPDQGWFPGKEYGVYQTTRDGWDAYLQVLKEWESGGKGDRDASRILESEYKASYLVLSRGLGNTDWMPRFNNKPEIVVVDYIGSN